MITIPQSLLLLSSIVILAGNAVPTRAQQIPVQLTSAVAQPDSIWVDSLDLSHVQQGYGMAQSKTSVDRHPITLGGIVYTHGIGTHAIGKMIIDLHGKAILFRSAVGVDDKQKKTGSVTFSVWVDGRKVQETGVLHGGDHPQSISADLTGAKRLVLCVGDAGDGIINDHADWAGALITLAPGAGTALATANGSEPPPRLKILPEDPKPAIHGAQVIGTTPGHPFLFAISATGTPPLVYTAENLPAGLNLDAATGVITGTLQQAGTYKVSVTVGGSAGQAHRILTIVGGDHELNLTPQLGWNSWNVWGNSVDEGKVKAAADEMVSAGLLAHGYQFVNIDQGWQGERDAQGNIQSNSNFPDMKDLSDYVHAKGLRIGLYSSPGPKTCGPYLGSFQHEDQDARTYAQWGFDYLKYDWCSYEMGHTDHTLPTLQHPYEVMRSSLDKVDRDLVYSLCQYGWGDVWKWGADDQVRGNSWRTHSDIDDVWTGTSDWGNDRGVYDIIQAEVGHAQYAGPGHWNDPDMLMVGIVGFGNTHPTHLTKDEQIVHVSMWAMLAAPLLIGCDMTKLDEFTRAILTNDEVLDIDQDLLGKAADRISKDANLGEIWARPLSDGTHAVALMNGAPDDEDMTVSWTDLGISGPLPVRDLWLHQDLGSFEKNYSVKVPSHGIVLLKIGYPTP